MLSFPEEFFKDEIRDGFLVSEAMKLVWASQLGILERIKDLCDKYGIRYCAEVGTLLGAVRHKGYIPWDDDIDLAMMREDYNTFLQHGDEIGGGLTVRSIYNTDSYKDFHATVTHEAEKLEWDDGRMEEYHGCPFICTVDIFPLDYYPEDDEEFEIFRGLYGNAFKMARDIVGIEDSQYAGRMVTLAKLKKNDKAEAFLKGLLEYRTYAGQLLGKEIEIDEEKPLRNQLFRLADEMAQRGNRDKARGADYCPKLARGDLRCWPKESYAEQEVLPFEVTTVSAPKGYHEVLATLYGPDYMTPMKGTADHRYPYFKPEINVLVNGDIGELYLYPGKKKYITQSVAVLEDAAKELPGHIEGNLQVLADMQTLAAKIGSYVETVAGYGTGIVHNLEAYCEDVYELFNAVTGGAGQDAVSPFFGRMTQDLLQVRRSTFREFRGEIPESMESFLAGADGSDGTEPVLVGMSASGVLMNSTEEITRVKNTVKNHSESGEKVIVFASKGVKDFMDKCGLEFKASYLELLQELESDSEVLLIEDPGTKEIDAALSVCSIYEGDQCRLSELCFDAGLEVRSWA